jgi:transposase InsO family protein
MLNLSLSSYYYKSKGQSQEQIKQENDLRGHIEQIALEFPRYGYRRITRQLRREGIIANHKRVLRLMRESSLLVVAKRKWVKTTDSTHGYPVYSNLAKDLILTNINQLWIADITYIRILLGFVYLAVILDAFSRKALGYSISKNLDAEFALAALRMAIQRRFLPKGVIHHSDQGVQYASETYTQELLKHGFRISMARRGNPFDNAKAESFIKTLKSEEVYLWEYSTLEDVQKRVPYFIEAVYNQKRLHSALGYLPPDEFEASLFEKEQINPAPCQLVLT